jgi:hypothetical protein
MTRRLQSENTVAKATQIFTFKEQLGDGLITRVSQKVKGLLKKANLL